MVFAQKPLEAILFKIISEKTKSWDTQVREDLWPGMAESFAKRLRLQARHIKQALISSKRPSWIDNIFANLETLAEEEAEEASTASTVLDSGPAWIFGWDCESKRAWRESPETGRQWSDSIVEHEKDKEWAAGVFGDEELVLRGALSLDEMRSMQTAKWGSSRGSLWTGRPLKFD